MFQPYVLSSYALTCALLSLVQDTLERASYELDMLITSAKAQLQETGTDVQKQLSQ